MLFYYLCSKRCSVITTRGQETPVNTWNTWNTWKFNDLRSLVCVWEYLAGRYESLILSRNLHTRTYPLHRAVALIRKKPRLKPQFNESGNNKINSKQIGKFDILVSGWYCGKDTVLLILTDWNLISYRLKLEPWFLESFYSRDERTRTRLEPEHERTRICCETRKLIFLKTSKTNEHEHVFRCNYWTLRTRTNTNTWAFWSLFWINDLW